MKIETRRSPVLLNSEVAALLRERGAESRDQFSRAANVEKAALEYLTTVAPTRAVERAAVAAFQTEAAKLGLASAEIVQMVNTLPTSAVDVHLIVEDVETRFGEGTDEAVEKVLKLVQEHFLPEEAAAAAAAPAAQ